MIAFAIRIRFPKAGMPISVFSKLTSKSRRTSPVISCSKEKDSLGNGIQG